MKRREQEARIEQQRQEKERAREDAARERARSEPVLDSCVLSDHSSANLKIPYTCPLVLSFYI